MKVNAYIRSSGITAKAFAATVGVTPACISQIINGRRNPSPELALKIEEATGGAISAVDLVFGSKSPLLEIANAA